ncbi:hypothetical protein TNCV_2690011 [Trichonephila clavipes]|uniref:Uncharacterized protein n=1 Tax=Trichonephila clavipes TaxID=2585209 RepID=A0A8X7BA61_TRICX|nr:hypothetical protein TNCV_2690011 [Trichonephila clavipes]
MATGSYLTPIYSRSQSEVLGDHHKYFEVKSGWRQFQHYHVESCSKQRRPCSQPFVQLVATCIEKGIVCRSMKKPIEHVAPKRDKYQWGRRVDTDIVVWEILSEGEIMALDHNKTERDQDESEELTPITLTEKLKCD